MRSVLFPGGQNAGGLLSGRPQREIQEFIEALEKVHPELTGHPVWCQDHVFSGKPLDDFLQFWESYYKQWIEDRFDFTFRSIEMENACTPMPLKNKYYNKIGIMLVYDEIFQSARKSGKLYYYISRYMTVEEFKTISAIDQEGVTLMQDIPHKYLLDTVAINGLCDIKLIEFRNGQAFRTHKSLSYINFAPPEH